MPTDEGRHAVQAHRRRDADDGHLRKLGDPGLGQHAGDHLDGPAVGPAHRRAGDADAVADHQDPGRGAHATTHGWRHDHHRAGGRQHRGRLRQRSGGHEVGSDRQGDGGEEDAQVTSEGAGVAGRLEGVPMAVGDRDHGDDERYGEQADAHPPGHGRGDDEHGGQRAREPGVRSDPRTGGGEPAAWYGDRGRLRERELPARGQGVEHEWTDQHAAVLGLVDVHLEPGHRRLGFPGRQTQDLRRQIAHFSHCVPPGTRRGPLSWPAPRHALSRRTDPHAASHCILDAREGARPENASKVPHLGDIAGPEDVRRLRS